MLGAIGVSLGAVASFFDPPWRRPSPSLESAARGELGRANVLAVPRGDADRPDIHATHVGILI
ncbi:hypothetical protein OV079_16165 [Nannocystis pusilla]|uniref:Uncharacterized protein n=1 Tax=Nannocystis pusilla TaxID=889268 RepID=A0A9X3IY07_9BACT|nr:hypothetical protein [Nannocystis pusilla]MCY1007064.1 hypothetical protein [Nannocystis pusilla]